MTDFTMPSLGADMEKGTVAHWLVKPGDAVHPGQIIVQVETDKGLIDVETFEEGVVDTLLVAEKTQVKVGTPLARIRNEAKERQASTPLEARERVRATPLARARAKELNVDLSTVTAAGDRITKEDVEALAKPRSDTDALRRGIAAAMAKSKREIPHYYLSETVDVTSMLSWLSTRNEARPVTARLLSTALFAEAVARTAAQHPAVNGQHLDGKYTPAARVHLSVAVSLRGGGVVAPAILDADKKDLDELMQEITSLTERVRGGGVKASEMTAGTITLTSLGDRAVEALFPIIQPPQVAIIGVGSVETRPWVVDGAVVPRSVVTLSFAGDHRVSDGVTGARFLSEVARFLSRERT